MKIALLILLTLTTTALVLLVGWRHLDHRADQAKADWLLATQPNDPPRFNMSMVEALPEPARRFFAFTIADGTPLYHVARIEMHGQFSLGSKTAPNYMKMNAQQVLAAPTGFLWSMSGGSGLMRLSGSDSGSWTRFWLAGVVPVARFGGDPNHTRSAFGRYAAEAAFWTPAALLPETGVVWEAVDDTTARFTMQHNGVAQSVDLTVDAEGRPTQIVFDRWSNANPEAKYRLQPFGGYLSEFQEFQGFTLPTHIEAGNNFGTDAYFPFYIADVTSLKFPVRMTGGKAQ